jgi:hypothetical protein
MEKNIYCISNYGSITCYYHFFYAVLIPLIYYDIKTNNKFAFVMKINMGNMFKILQDIFGDRIRKDYINDKAKISDKFEYYDLYIDLLKNKKNNGNDVLLDAYDIFTNSNIFDISKYDYNTYKKLEESYIDYHWYKKSDKKPKNYNEIKNYYLKNKDTYKNLYIMHKYMKLKKIRPLIIDFFESKSNITFPDMPSKTKKIVLIERQIPEHFNDHLGQNRGGQRRIIYNHDKLKNKLDKTFNDNFINVVLEKLNIFQQYILFKNADIIIAQHGSGLANIFFCKSNTKVIEIVPRYKSCYSPEFKHLSRFFDLNYKKMKQKKFVIADFEKFNNKYKLLTYDKNIFDNIHVEQDRIMYSPIIYFIKSSGFVNIKKIIKLILN